MWHKTKHGKLINTVVSITIIFYVWDFFSFVLERWEELTEDGRRKNERKNKANGQRIWIDISIATARSNTECKNKLR
jgi:hypothetical protein